MIKGSCRNAHKEFS